MARIFRDATPEQEQAFIEERRKFAFLAANKGSSWLRTAERHKRAADILYEVAHAAHEREMAQAREEMARIRAEMDKQGLSSWSESKTLGAEELNDFLDSELLSEYLLLSGYALECVLKGCLLAMRPGLVKDGKKLDRAVTTHNLAQLCHDCGISLSPIEQQVINIIAWHVDWRKYPVPKDLKDMPSPVEPNPTPLDIPGSPFHERKVQTLVNVLFKRVYDLLKTAQQSNDKVGPEVNPRVVSIAAKVMKPTGHRKSE